MFSMAIRIIEGSGVVRQSGSSERTAVVARGGKVVAERTFSKDEARESRRRSGSGAGDTIDLLNQAIADENERRSSSVSSSVSSDPLVAVRDPVSRTSRVLSPFERAGLVGVSTEQGPGLVPLISQRDIPRPVSRLTQADIDAIPASELRSQRRASRRAVRSHLAEVREDLARKAFSEREERRASRLTPLDALFGDITTPGEAFISGFDEVVSTGVISRHPDDGPVNDFFRVNVAGALAAGVPQFAPLAVGFFGNTQLAAINAARTVGVPGSVSAVGLASAQGAGLGRLSRSLDVRAVPSEFKPFVRDNAIFRSSLAAERAADPSFLGRQLTALNVGFSRRPDVFSREAERQLISAGFSDVDVDRGLSALQVRRSRAPTNEFFRTLAAGVSSEVSGREFTSLIDTSGMGFARRFRTFGAAIFPAGVAEVRSELAGSRAAVGSDLPFIDRSEPLRSLVPDVSFRGGLSVDFRSRLSEDIFLGGLGGLTAAGLGGLAGAGASAPRGLSASGRTRALGRVSELVGDFADPSEVVTDFLAGDVGFAPVLTPSVSAPRGRSLSRLARSPAGLSFASVPELSSSVFVQSSFTVPSLPSFAPVPVQSRVPSVSRAFSIVPVPERRARGVSPRSQTFIQPFNPQPISPLVNVPSQPQIQPFSFVDVPSQPQPQVPSNVPVLNAPVNPLVANARFPPPVPLSFPLGGSGFGFGGSRRVSFVDELSAARNFLAGSVGSRSSSRRPSSARRGGGSSRRVAFPDPLAGLRGGLFG